MNIDEPIKAAEALIASDARQRSVVTEFIAEIAATLESPFGAIATFLNKRRAENLDLLVTVLRDNLQRLIERVGQLSEEQQRFLRTDFAELVADGLRKAENIRAKNRIVRIAMILGTVAETGPSMLLDNAEELMRIAVNLSDLDVAVLLEIYHAQSEHLKTARLDELIGNPQMRLGETFLRRLTGFPRVTFRALVQPCRVSDWSLESNETSLNLDPMTFHMPS